MMGAMRDLAKWVLYILIIAFVALMVFEWGADYSASGGLFNSNVVGVVNDQEITIQDFERAYQIAYRNQQDQGANMDDAQAAQLRDQVWENFVQRILLQDEVERLNITVTDADVTNDIIYNPDPQTRQNPNLQTDGRFDPSKYREVLMHPDNAQLLLMMEEDRRANLPFRKLIDYMAASIIVTEQELRQEYAEQNVKARIEYLHVPTAAFRDKDVAVTDKEIEQYYKDNRDDFKVDEKRTVNYIFVSTTPTAQDTARVHEDAEYILEQLGNGEDFTALAKGYSQDPSVETNNGDLGFFDRNTMVKEFSDAAFAAEVGDVVGPIKTQFGLHIIQVYDKRVEEGTEQVAARHILLKFEASGYTVDTAMGKAREFADLAKEEGFAAAADQLGMEIQETPEFSRNRIGTIPTLGQAGTAMDWVFNMDKGDVSEVYRLTRPEGYAVLEVASITPEGYRPLDEENVREMCRSRVETEKRRELARAYAENLAGRVGNSSDFNAMAAADTAGTLRADTTAFFPRKAIIPRLGRAPEITAAAFELEPGTTSGLIGTDRGFYFIRVKERTEFNETAFVAQKETLRQTLMARKQQTLFQNWYEKLKEHAEIEDRRYMFYTS